MINPELELIDEYKEDIQTLDRYAHELDFIAEMTYDNKVFAGVEISEPTEEDIIK